MMIDTITFDFWSTLYQGPVDASWNTRRVDDALQIINQSSGRLFRTEDIKQAFKSSWKEAYRRQRVHGEEMAPQGQIRHILQFLNIKLDETAWQRLYQAYTGILLQEPPRLNNGVAETLPQLADKYRLAVICNTGLSPGTVLREVMKRQGIDRYFQVLVFSDEVGFAKPSPRIFAHTLQQLGSRSNRSAHVGDDSITDVIGAKRYGMTAVWLSPKPKWPAFEADYHIRSVAEVPGLFARQ